MGMDLAGKSGNYFRANVWSWRPIHALCLEVNQEHHLGLEFENWDSNSSGGLKSQADCDKLAAAIEAHIGQLERYVLETGWATRVNDKGQLVDGPGRSPYETDREHILEFVKFLRECGGSFEIW